MLVLVLETCAFLEVGSFPQNSLSHFVLEVRRVSDAHSLLCWPPLPISNALIARHEANPAGRPPTDGPILLIPPPYAVGLASPLSW